MAVLTAIERATISGYVDTMESYGYDLAIIDAQAASCPLCAPWEDVIVSVSGDNHDYPSLDEAKGAGCFHPRCTHGIVTYYPGISEKHFDVRNHPGEVEPASDAYSARSRQRYCERMAQKYRDRALVAQTPQQKMQANNKAREWSKAAREQKQLHFHSVSDNMRTRQTGGKTPLWMDTKRQNKRAEQAERAYSFFRKADDTVTIARASGLSEADIRTIKDHVFFEKHVLYDGYDRFPADYDMAVAWMRLSQGTPEDRDITLLRHELVEAQVEAAGAPTLSYAHQTANAQYNWERQLEKEKGEEGEDDGLLQAYQP